MLGDKQNFLAKEFGVTQSMISRITNLNRMNYD